jgi:hypothetical protein
MARRLTYVAVVIAGSLTIAGVLRAQQPSAPAPTYIPQVQFDAGQDVVPVYEGWIRNPDGTFDFVFGYMNRNFKQELAIPAGPDNIVEPGGPDRGQPTYFLPRRQARLFRVRVPKDWGNKTLTWSITANGRTERAYGDLRAVEEINERIMESGGNSLPYEPGNENPNKPPAITIAPVGAAAVSSPLRIVANVTDDGLPKPRVVQTPPAAPAGRSAQQGQANTGGQANGQAAPRARGGLSVRWIQYGGPARVTFTPSGAVPVANGTAAVSAQFTMPGTYKLMATATDGQLSTKADVTAVVK